MQLLKLYAWTLEEYHRVVHLDMDSLVLQPIDELFALDQSLIYTCDYNMQVGSSLPCYSALCPPLPLPSLRSASNQHSAQRFCH